VFVRDSLAIGYIPMSWRHIRVVFILSQAKSLRPIILMSFILKTLEKLIDTHIKDGVLVERPLHQNQFACRAAMPFETVLFRFMRRLEESLNRKEIALGAFLDIKGAFKNTSLTL